MGLNESRNSANFQEERKVCGTIGSEEIKDCETWQRCAIHGESVSFKNVMHNKSLEQDGEGG